MHSWRQFFHEMKHPRGNTFEPRKARKMVEWNDGLLWLQHGDQTDFLLLFRISIRGNFMLLRPVGNHLLQSQRTMPPKVVNQQFRGKKASRCAISRIFNPRNMIPSFRRNKVNDCRDSITHIGLKAPGIPYQPVQDYSAISPSIYVGHWYLKHFLGALNEACEDMGTTELKTWDR